jgi:hypothetical protein
MATAVVDPSMAKFFPECLIECVDQAAITTGGNNVCSYTLQDRYITVEKLEVDPIANMDVTVAADGFGEKMKIRSDVPAAADTLKMRKIFARKNFSVSNSMTVGAATHAWNRWNVTVRKPDVVTKCRYGVSLEQSEEKLVDDLNILDALSLGTLPRYGSLLNDDVFKQFDEIIAVDRLLPAIAALGTGIVGSQINVNPGNVNVLLGVMVDSSIFAAVFSDSYMIMQRDDNYNYMKLDCSGMPDQTYMRCFVPFIDKMQISIYSQTGSAAGTVPAGFIYGVRKMNIIDHIKWGLGYKSPIEASEADDIIAKFESSGLYAKIKAGIY